METNTRHSPSSKLVQPYLIVTFGGAGQTLATHVKALLIERRGRVPDSIRFLALDTADAVPPVRVREQDVALIPGEEFLRLNRINVPGLYKYRDMHESFGPWFPAGFERDLRLGDSVDEGAAQKRSLANIAYIYYYQSLIAPAIERALVALTVANRSDWLRVPHFIVAGGAAGGHSELPIPIVAGIRGAAAHAQVNLQDAVFWGLISLPGGNPHATTLSEANAGALLAELSAAQDVSNLTVPLPGGTSVSFAERAPFNHLVLGSVFSQDNSHLESDGQLLRMLAESAIQIIDTSEGELQRARARDQWEATSRRGIRGDVCCFSTQSIVVAEARGADVANYLDNTALAALAEVLLAPASSEPLGRHDAGALAAATETRNAVRDTVGRTLLPDLVTEVGESLTADRPKNADLAERINTLVTKFMERRLPWVATRSAERAREAWAAVARGVEDEVSQCLDTRDVRRAWAVIDDALERLEHTEITAPDYDAAETTRLAGELAKALRGLPRPGKTAAIDRAIVKLLKARAVEFGVRAETTARDQLVAARVAVLGQLTELRTATGAIIAALEGVARDAAAASADAAVEAARTADGTNQRALASILHYQVLTTDDLARAYAECLYGSRPEALSERAQDALIGGLGTLADWLGADQGAITARLRGVVRPYFVPWRERGIEEMLTWLGPEAAHELRRHLRALCVERVNYQVELLPDAQRPRAIWTLSVPDRETTVFASESDIELVSSGDHDRIVLSGWWLGIPASALAFAERAGREIAKALAAGHPLFNIPGFHPLVPGLTAPATLPFPVLSPGSGAGKANGKDNGEVPAGVSLAGTALAAPLDVLPPR